jgi:hypothetical protein
MGDADIWKLNITKQSLIRWVTMFSPGTHEWTSTRLERRAACAQSSFLLCNVQYVRIDSGPKENKKAR